MFKFYSIRTATLSILLLGLLFFAPACKKSSGSDGGNANTTGYHMTATIDGQAWEANVPFQGLSNAPAVGGVTHTSAGDIMILIGFKAVNKDTSGFAIVFPKNIPLLTATAFDVSKNREGAYITETTSGSGTYNTYNTSTDTQGSGTITVTALDESAKTIEGTFSGVFGSQNGKPSIQITNGKFRCIYTDDINELPLTGKF